MVNSQFGAVPPLSKLQKIALKVMGQVFIGYMQPAGYSAPVPVYVLNCSKHGPYLDNPHGFAPDQRFYCPHCNAVFVKRLEAPVTC